MKTYNTYQNDPKFWNGQIQKTLEDGKWTRLSECPFAFASYQRMKLKHSDLKTVKLMAAYMSCKINNHKFCKNGKHFYEKNNT